jgi:hypothetical protein
VYPSPPHLTIAIWSPEEEESVFEWANDVAVELGCVATGAVDVAAGGQAVKVGYGRKGRGKVIVERLHRTDGEKRPVAVSLSAGALGWLEGLWKSEDRKAAQSLARWSTGVLRELAGRCGAVYGGIGVEETLPTPAGLPAGDPIGRLVFVSASVPDTVIDQFRAAFGPGANVLWPHREFFAGWHPFGSGSGPVAVDNRSLGSASIALGRAAGN